MVTSLQTRCSCATVLLLLCLAGPWGLGIDRAHAQERRGDRPHSLHAGTWALQFGVGENVTLDPFLGSTISGKRHTSAARAWQVGLTLDASVRSDDEEDSGTDDQETLTLTARYLAYPLLDTQDVETVQLYLGAGPQLSFQRDGGGGQGASQTSTRWGIGLSGTIGAEWFVHRRISLSGAYEAALLYRREQVEIERPGEDEERSSNRYALEAGGVRFGVSVYF